MQLVAALLFSGSALFAQSNDWLIVPGKRLGPITAETNRKALDRLFGKRNVVDRDVDNGDEGPEPATVVFPKDSTAGLAIFWGQDQRVGWAMVCFERATAPCRWHTKEGITLGTSWRRLENLNGRPFELVEFDIDGAGNTSSWKGGKLAHAFDDGLQLNLWYASASPAKEPTAQQKRDLDELDRLKRFPLSSDPALRRLNPRVEGMTFFFPNR
jgi:hypothetical protein